MSDSFAQKFAERYGPHSGKSDAERYLDFIDEVLGTELSEAQQEIVRAGAENRKTAIQSSNGLGKSYSLSNLALAFLYCNPQATVLITSASYSTMVDTLFKPMSSMIDQARERTGGQIPGKTLKAPPRVEFDGNDDSFLKCISTSNAKDLEGRHNDRILVIVEECDSDKVSAEVIDSAQSSITGEQDRMVAIGNPPLTKANSFHQVMNDRTWKTLQFSSFESRNVQVDLGEHDGNKIPGLVDLSTLKDDWISFNKEDWVGVEDARASQERTDLDQRWYRRRLGVTPPDNANATRPFYSSQIDSGARRWNPVGEVEKWSAIGVDLATSDGSDATIAVGVTEERAEVLYEVESPTSSENKDVLRACDDLTENLITDAIREENFLDSIATNVIRFKGSFSAEDDQTYRNRRSEAYFELGDWLENGGSIDPNSDLAYQMYEVAEVAEAKIKSLRSSETYLVTPKDEIKPYIDASSPDFVDAISMACWQLRAGSKGRQVEPTFNQKDLFA